MSVCNVRAFFAAVRKFERRKPLLKTSGHVLETGWARLLLDGRTVYDFADAVERAAGDSNSEMSEHAAPLSLVGPVLSIDVEQAGKSGGGPPQNGGTWKTLDARTGHSANLFEWVDERALIAALKQDAFVKRAVNPQILATIDTAAKLDALGSKWTESLLGPLHSTFCFFDYDPKKDLVAVRFPLYANMGFDHSKIEAIAVWVPPKRALREALIAAKKGHGLFARKSLSTSPFAPVP